MIKNSIGLEIQELIGEGSQGRVYRAVKRDPVTGLSQTVAVKILHSETAVEAWKKEFQSLQSVRSPYCVQVYGFDRIGKRPALVLEYVDGVSLAQLGRGCWLDESDIVEILAQLEAAVLDLHRFGAFHGDLSPHNILVDQDGGLRLLDFGMANCSPGMARATPAFTAPERLQGEPASLATDLFSIGRIEQFLRGKSMDYDPTSPYLAAPPADRALRLLELNKSHRDALAEKVRAFVRRQSHSPPMKTRTHLVAKAGSSFSVMFKILPVLVLFALSGSQGSLAADQNAVLQIRTQRWLYLRLNQTNLGYAPVQVLLDPGKTYTVEWTSKTGHGSRRLHAKKGHLYELTDRDFSH